VQVRNQSWETFWETNIAAGRRVRYHRFRNDDVNLVVGYRPLQINDARVVVEPDSYDWTTDPLSLWHVGPLEVGDE
jgi:hypothetical protein